MATKKQLAELLKNIKSGKVNINEAITKAETTARQGKYVWQEVGKEGQSLKMESGFVYQIRESKIFRIAEKQKRSDGKVAKFQLYFNAGIKKQKETVKA